MAKIIISIILLCLSAGLAFSMHKNRDNPDSVYTKALLRIKSLRLFPVLSMAYAFFALVILFFGLLLADKVSNYRHYLDEDDIVNRLSVERLTFFSAVETGEPPDQEYPLMMVRGREEIRKEHPKILVLGDSFVFGDGLSNINQIWWNILQSELDRRGYDCAVYAAGMGRASTYDEFCWLKDTSLLEDIQPDLIIIGYVTNDPDLGSMNWDKSLFSLVVENAQRAVAENFQIEETAGTMWYAQKGWGPAFIPNLYAFIGNKWLTRAGAYAAWEREMVESGHLENYSALVLRPLGEFVEGLGIPTIVIPTPTSPRGRNFELLYQAVLPLFEEAGLPVYNPLSRFNERYPKPNRKFDEYFSANPANSHPGPATSWFLGQYAADALEQHYPSILGEKSGRNKSKLVIEVNDWFPFMLGPQAMQESGAASRYTIRYPDQALEADIEKWANLNFLTYPLKEKYVKLNFKTPVRLSGVQIEGEDLLSAEVYTLAINEKLGFDDQKPVRLGGRRGNQCAWEDGSGRYVTSLLISAKTKDGKQAALTVTIESDGGEEAFY